VILTACAQQPVHSHQTPRDRSRRRSSRGIPNALGVGNFNSYFALVPPGVVREGGETSSERGSTGCILPKTPWERASFLCERESS